MRLNLISLELLLCFCFLPCFTYNNSFGEGIVTIGLYPIPPNYKGPSDPRSILNNPPYYYSTYLIKEDKIARDDDSSGFATNTALETRFEDGSTIRAAIVHPSYLIDWNNQQVHHRSKNSGGFEKLSTNLSVEASEIFYKVPDKDRLTVISTSQDDTVTIANNLCHRGIALTNNKDTVVIYYADAPSALRSPLNQFLPKNFPHNVLRLQASIDWSDNGYRSKVPVILQVLEFKACKLADSLFNISKS